MLYCLTAERKLVPFEQIDCVLIIASDFLWREYLFTTTIEVVSVCYRVLIGLILSDDVLIGYLESSEHSIDTVYLAVDILALFVFHKLYNIMVK